MKKGHSLDPKGLIGDSFKIDGITAGECRSIFLDWALSFDGDQKAAIEGLLEWHADAPDGHPMKATLREGLGTAAAPKRRGGRSARLS